MKASLKINQLASKISELESQKQLLLEERRKEIAMLIAALDLAILEDKVLVGGLQFLKHKITTKDPLMEGWYSAGERFLRQAKKTRSLHSSKKDPRPQSISQPPQKSLQSREKKNEDAKAS